jgi:hypothetical protein
MDEFEVGLAYVPQEAATRGFILEVGVADSCLLDATRRGKAPAGGNRLGDCSAGNTIV